MSLHDSLYSVKAGSRTLYRGLRSNEALAAVMRLSMLFRNVHMTPEVENGRSNSESA